MKCPKCGYIGFDDANRCRNCGYEFSLAPQEAPIDLLIARDEPGRLPELPLHAADGAPAARHDMPSKEAGARPGPAAAGRRALTPDELPLFIESFPDDQAPLVAPPAVPRPPLSVRRAHPADRHRPRSSSSDELPLEREPRGDEGDRAGAGEETRANDAAGISRRAAAGLIDVALLGSIAAAVVYLTLQLTQLTPAEWHRLPVTPLAGFLLLLCGGYFVLFTAAGGQTIGKMVTHIRVVDGSGAPREHVRVSFRTAMLRAVACLGSVLVAGAGFLPVLINGERRAFHDRVAGTRVVYA